MKIYRDSNHFVKSQVFHVGYGIAFNDNIRSGFINRYNQKKKAFSENVIEGLKIKRKQMTTAGFNRIENSVNIADNHNNTFNDNSNSITMLALLIIPVVLLFKNIFKLEKTVRVIAVFIFLVFCFNSIHSDTNNFVDNEEREIRKNPNWYKLIKDNYSGIGKAVGKPVLDYFNRNNNHRYTYKDYQYIYPLAATRIIAYNLLGPAAMAYIAKNNSSDGQPLPQVNLSNIKSYINFPLDDRYLPDYFEYAKKYYTHDGWGRPFKISNIRNNYQDFVMIKSAGADGQFNTSDDFNAVIVSSYYFESFNFSRINETTFLVFIHGGNNLSELIFIAPRIYINPNWNPVFIASKYTEYLGYQTIFTFKKLNQDFLKNKLQHTKSDLILYVFK